MDDFSGYWTGSFEGTNSGGLSFTITQKEKALSGHATIHEPALGMSQYTIIGEAGPLTKFRLSPLQQMPNLTYGIIQVNCRLVDNETLMGQWESSTGTNGVFNAHRYRDPALDKTWKAKHKNVFISYRHTDLEYLGKV